MVQLFDLTVRRTFLRWVNFYGDSRNTIVPADD
jgi:hypothetical protein